MRADGATVKEIRAYLTANGIQRSYHGTTTLLRSRLLVGEIAFGKWAGKCAAIVDRATWDRAQAVSVPRGRRAKSERLLARLGVLRCGTCGARMVVGTANHGRYALYRCPPTGDCPQRMTVSAELVEGLVTDAVRAALEGMVGRASADTDAQAAEVALERAQADMDSAIRAFAGVQDEPVALERIGELRAARDAARDRVHELRGLRSALEISATADWDALSVDARRALVRAVVDRVVVAAGRGAGRVTVLLRE
jgi:site-specific DNA recombinase